MCACVGEGEGASNQNHTRLVLVTSLLLRCLKGEVLVLFERISVINGPLPLKK